MKTINADVTPPTKERALRLAVSALRAAARLLAFDANLFKRGISHAQAAAAFQAYTRLHAAADLLEKDAERLARAHRSARAPLRKKAKVKP